MRYKMLYAILVSFIFLNLIGCSEKKISLHINEIPVILDNNKISLLKIGSFIVLKDKHEGPRFISVMKDFEVYKNSEVASIQLSVSNPEDVTYQVWTREEFLDDENSILTSGVRRRVPDPPEGENYKIDLPCEPRGKYVRLWVTLKSVKGEALIELVPITYYLSYFEKGGGFIEEAQM
ncbi:hypothetical protein ACFL08_01780 [Patescibacteria group bacterium]